MENFKQTNLEHIRIIAVSATIPNITDVAEFLEIKGNNNKGLKIFGEEYRPVKVERIVIGYKRNKNQNEFVFEKYLDYRVSSIIEKYSEGKPLSNSKRKYKQCKAINGRLSRRKT